MKVTTSSGHTRMRICRAVILIIGLFAFPVSGTDLKSLSTNLILNCGFEEFTGKENFEIGKPCGGWIINPAYPSEIQVAASGEARSGLKCLKMRPLRPEEIKSRKLQCHIPGRGFLGYESPKIVPEVNTVYEFRVWAKGKGSIGLYIGQYDEKGQVAAVLESAQQPLNSEWTRYSLQYFCKQKLSRITPAIYVHQLGTVLYLDDVAFEKSEVAPLFMNKSGNIRVLPDAWVYRGGKARIDIDISSATPVEGRLVVVATPEDGEKSASPITLYESQVTIPAANTLILDDFDDLSFPEGKPQIPAHWGTWKAAEEGKGRVLTLSNTGRYPDKPKRGNGSLWLNFRGGDGGRARSALKSPVEVGAEDCVQIAVHGIGSGAARTMKVILYTDKETRPFIHFAKGESKDSPMRDGLPLNHTGWKDFEIPIKDFIPFPVKPEDVNNKPIINKINAVEFWLGDEPVQFAVDDLSIIQGGSNKRITGLRTNAVWDLSSLNPGRYILKASQNCGDGFFCQGTATVAVMPQRGAPMKAEVVKTSGGNFLKVNGKPVPFWMNNSGSPHMPVVAAYARQGIHIHVVDFANSIDWIGDGDYNDSDFASRVAEAICFHDPETVGFMFRPNFVPSWYMTQHASEYRWPDKNIPPDISKLDHNCHDTIPSQFSTKFQKDIAEYIFYLTHTLRGGIFGDRFLGLFLFSEAYEGGVGDWSPVAMTAFREYLRAVYANKIEALSTAWKMQDVNFETTEMPSRKSMEASDLWGLFRSQNRQIEDYVRFTTEMDNGLLNINQTAKDAADGNIINVRMNGYIFTADSSSKDENRYYHSPSIDALCSTCYYSPQTRLGGAAEKRMPVDSVRLAGKLFVAEFDHDCNPWAAGSGRDADDSLEIVRRSVAQCVVKGFCPEWYDMPPEYRNIGQYTAPRIAEAIQAGLRQVSADLDGGKTPDYSADRRDGIAFVMDERWTALHVGDLRFLSSINANSMRQPLNELPFIGTRVDSYRLADVATMPDYPVVILYMCLRMSDEEMATIRKRFCNKGHTVVFVWPPALFGGKKPIDLARSSELCGIELKSLDKPMSSLSRITSFDHPFTTVFKNFIPRPLSIKQDPKYWPNSARVEGEAVLIGLNDWSPGILASDRAALTIALAIKGSEKTIDKDPGTYPHPVSTTETGEPTLASVAVKEMDGWTSVYSAVAFLPAELLRAIAKARGVPVYDESGDATWVSDRYVAVHVNAKGGHRTLNIPFSFKKATELFSGQVMIGPARSVEWEARPYTTTLWMIERE